MKAPLCKYVNKNADHAGKRGRKHTAVYKKIPYYNRRVKRKNVQNRQNDACTDRENCRER
jgi:hypothetical protein